MSLLRRLFGKEPPRPPAVFPSLNLNIPPTAFAEPPQRPAILPAAQQPLRSLPDITISAVLEPVRDDPETQPKLENDRQGTSGGATGAQVWAIEQFYGAAPDDNVTMEAASMALTVRDYVSAIAALSAEAGKPVSATAMRVVSARILSEPINCKTLRTWGNRRFERGTHYDAPRLTANRLFMRVLFDLHRADGDIDSYLSEVR